MKQNPILLSTIYEGKIYSENLHPDNAQLRAINSLQSCLDNLQKPAPLFTKKPPIKGKYLWGPVGRGKTMLMDLFCQCLPENSYLRLHFHRFMRMTHEQLFIHSGEADPLEHIAKELSSRYQIICFDEFYVSDIGDAMLLGRLMTALFKHGVTIVCTSNTHPDQLYTDGLHRDRFLPAIETIKHNLDVEPLDGGIDHRKRVLAQEEAYFINNEAPLEVIFKRLSGSCPIAHTVQLAGRTIPCRAISKDSIWLDFSAICEGPRSSHDYIELAERFTHVLINNVPCFRGIDYEQIKARGTEDSPSQANSTGSREVRQNNFDDPARRFISLVDELYDNRTNLYISAEVALNCLYQGELLANPFKRTLSRLIEMSSAEYQANSSNHLNVQRDYSAFQNRKLNPARDPE
ncbi:MAG: cell division protein ZapE [Neptuniibacter sp.]